MLDYIPTQLNSTSYPKVANTRKEAQYELMYIYP